MANGEVALNLTEIISALSPQFLERLGGLMTIFKAVGIVALVYLVYLVVMGVFNFRSIKRMRYIEKKVNEIDEKLDRLLKFKKKK